MSKPFLCLLVFSLIVCGSLNHRISNPSVAAETMHPRALAQLARLPLRFESNAGQAAAPTKFIARGQGYDLFLTPTASVFRWRDNRADQALEMRLLNANPQPRMRGAEPLDGLSHYFSGRSPQGWQRNVKGFAQVVYENVWPKIDLVYYGQAKQEHSGQLEYDFRVAAGAQPERIGWQINGAQKLHIDKDGNLLLEMPTRTVKWLRPNAYQEQHGQRVTVSCAYELSASNRVGFQLGAYDRRLPLVIDPALAYLTPIGGTGEDTGLGIAVDSAGAVYLCGQTSSLDLPGTTPLPANPPRQRDAYVLKLDPTGSRVVYAAYFGGSNDDSANAVAVDAAGNAYFTGETASSDLPTTANAPQRTRAGRLR